jgi:hypothetical protein
MNGPLRLSRSQSPARLGREGRPGWRIGDGSDRDRVFEPFQRLGDRDNHTGVGHGLALARGLTEAMNGTLVPEETPGGGLTLPVAVSPAIPQVAGAVTEDRTAHPVISHRIGAVRAASRRGKAP